jgi:NAD(P)-dependent dehydrogenase (short-subunit alcohol dehydrogenase family)
MMRLQGKTALVTGGGSGIGRAIAQRFVEEGARVAINGRRKVPLEEAANAIGGDILALTGDVSDEAEVDAIVRAVVARWGRIDVLVNNAAVIVSRTALVDTPVDAWDRMTAINVRSVYLVCKAVLPHMIDEGSGAVVNIASVAGQRGQPSNSAYSTTKAAILNLTRSIAVDYGQYGIRANSISPALVRTEMAETRLKPGDDWDERAAREWIPNYPLGRLGRPEDIAAGVLFLASDDASWVSGVDLTMDGGMMAKL